MPNAYLLAFADKIGKAETMKSYLDMVPEITTWRYDMAHAFYLISDANAKTPSWRKK